MSTQPEALELADALEDAGKPAFLAESAAAELRRLHAENRLLHERHHGDNIEYTRVLAQRDALLRALNMAVQWVEEYASQMRAYTTSEQANADLSVIYAAIKMAEEGK